MLSLNNNPTKLIFFFLFLSISISQSVMQKNVTFTFNQTPLDEVLEFLKKETQINLLYSDQHLSDIKLTLTISNVPLQDALDKIFSSIPLEYEYDTKMNLLLIKEELIDLKGYVVDTSNEQLPYAVVRIANTEHATYANKYGYFALVDVPYKNYNIQVEHIGYEPRSFKLHQLKLGHDIEFELEPQIFNSEIQQISTNTSFSSFQTDQQRTAFSVDAISILPEIGAKDIFRSLQVLPGVGGNSTGSADLHIRGGTPDQNLIKLDGMTFYHTDHFFGFYSAFNPRIIKDILLYKGAYSSKYGGRVAGVLELTGKTASFNEVNVNTSIDFVNYQANVGFPIAENMSLMVAIRNSLKNSNLLNNVNQFISNQKSSTSYVENPVVSLKDSILNFYNKAYTFNELNSKLSYIPTKNDIINLNFYQNIDSYKSDYSYEKTNKPDLNGYIQSEWGNIGTSIQWFHTYNSRFSSNIFLATSDYKTDYDLYFRRKKNNGTIESDKYDQRNAISNHNLIMDNELTLSNEHQLNFGLDISLVKSKFKSIDKDSTQKSTTSAIYLEDIWKIDPTLSVTMGSRFIHDSYSKSYDIEPRLIIDKQIIPQVNFQIAGGVYHQHIKKIINNNVLDGSRDLFLLSDGEKLKIDQSKKIQAALQYKSSNTSFNIDVYKSILTNISQIEIETVITENEKLRTKPRLFNGEGESTGIEFFFQHAIENFNFSAGFTQSTNEIKLDGVEEYFESSFSNEQKLNLILNYENGTWGSSLSYLYLSGRPYTKFIYSSFYDLYYRKAINNGRLPDMYQLDYKLSNTYTFFGIRTEIGLTITNLFNRENIADRYYSLTYEHRPIFKNPKRVVISDINLIENKHMSRTFSLYFEASF